MGILSFTVKGNDIGLIDGKRIKLDKHKKLKYLKLLHIYHNLETSNLSTEDDRDQQRILFCNFSFINTDEVYNATEENTFLTVSGTKHSSDGTVINRDLYKVLYNGGCKYLNDDIIVKFYYLDHDANIKQLTSDDVVGSSDEGNTSYFSFTFEYQEIYNQ